MRVIVDLVIVFLILCIIFELIYLLATAEPRMEEVGNDRTLKMVCSISVEFRIFFFFLITASTSSISAYFAAVTAPAKRILAIHHLLDTHIAPSARYSLQYKKSRRNKILV